MDSKTTIRIATLSPVRSPINANSEQRAAGAFRNCPDDAAEQGNKLLPHTEVLSDFPWPWTNGYGTLAHDNLPELFQPFECYEVEPSACFAQSENLRHLAHAWSGEIETCQLFLYDDTVALLRLDVLIRIDDITLDALIASGDLDRTLSDAARDIYQRHVYPSFQAYCHEFSLRFGKRKQASPHQLRDPGQLTIFRDVQFDPETAPVSHVLWTGRCIVVTPDVLNGPVGERLRQWASFSGSIDDLGRDHHYVGSGNILVVNDTPEACREDWFRGLSICQFYNAILFIYGAILKSSYSQLTDLLSARRTRNRELNRLMSNITLSLDHLEFSRLEFNEARVGVQGDRTRIVEDTCKAWQLDTLISSALERTDLIRSRIARLLDTRKSRLDKTVELILAGIGGVALVDLFISLTTVSRSLPKDDIPGLLDAFLLLPPDGSIGLASLLLVVVFIYIYLAKR